VELLSGVWILDLEGLINLDISTRRSYANYNKEPLEGLPR
jgi:hypothetical protein